MGTRGALGFRIGEQDKVVYNHFDSYPSGLGVNVLTDLQTHFIGQPFDAVLAQLHKVASELRLIVDGKPEPTEADIKRYQKFANTSVDSGELTDWYVLLRNAQGGLKAYLSGDLDIMDSAASFLLDSLFCEWAYIINMDIETFEIYKGFNKDPEAPGRYAAQRREKDGEYFGIELIQSWPLENLFNGTITTEIMSRQEQFAAQRSEYKEAWRIARETAQEKGGSPSMYFMGALQEIRT